MKNHPKKRIFFISAVCLIVILIGYLIIGNTTIKITNYAIASDRLPSSFDGFRIAQVSDLHNAEFGKDNTRLLDKLRKIQPDLIVLTGDLVDSYKPDCDIAVSFARQAAAIAPTYYIPGNHESRITQLDEFYSHLSDAGVTLLLDDIITLSRGQDTVTLMGILDPGFRKYGEKGTSEIIKEMMPENGEFTILLSHRPENFSVYTEQKIDLVLTGHAHGGQFRIPFIGGLYAPGQGFFPQYDAGLFTEDRTNMIISRGLGNSSFPIRFNNPPEIVVIELQSCQ